MHSTSAKFLLLLSVLFLAAPLAAKTPAPAKASARRAAMARALKLWAYDKGTDVVSDVTGVFDSKSQKVTLKCYLKNLTKKEIHGVRGTLRFTTFFGEVITDQPLQTVLPIPAGRTLSVTWDIPAERFTAKALESFKKLKLEQMKQVWFPTMIVFTDGSTLQ